MSNRALRKVTFVLYVLSAPPALRRDILSTASSTLLKLICEIVLNIADGNLNGREFLQMYKSECKLILKRSHSVKRKRETILAQGDDFFDRLTQVLKQYA